MILRGTGVCLGEEDGALNVTRGVLSNSPISIDGLVAGSDSGPNVAGLANG